MDLTFDFSQGAGEPVRMYVFFSPTTAEDVGHAVFADALDRRLRGTHGFPTRDGQENDLAYVGFATRVLRLEFRERFVRETAGRFLKLPLRRMFARSGRVSRLSLDGLKRQPGGVAEGVEVLMKRDERASLSKIAEYCRRKKITMSAASVKAIDEAIIGTIQECLTVMGFGSGDHQISGDNDALNDLMFHVVDYAVSRGMK